MTTDWYVRIADVESGPLSSDGLRHLARSGKVTPETPIKKGASGNWMPASRLKGLFASPVASNISQPFPPAEVVLAEVVPTIDVNRNKVSQSQGPKGEDQGDPLAKLAAVIANLSPADRARLAAMLVGDPILAGELRGLLDFGSKPTQPQITAPSRPGPPPLAMPVSKRVGAPTRRERLWIATLRDLFFYPDDHVQTPPQKPRSTTTDPASAVTGCFTIIIFIAAACWFFGVIPDDGGSTTPVGNTFRFRKDVFAGSTKADLDRITQLSVAKDVLGLREMEAEGRLMEVSAGTQATVIDAGILSSEVRIMSGPLAGQAVWVDSDFVR